MMRLRFSFLYFVGIFTALYFLLIAAGTVIGWKGRPALDGWVEYSSDPGGRSATLERFRDVENYRNIDVLFLGSSHAYRLFDTRVFARSGLTSFNMGSVAQTPLNAYYLLERYYSRLRPRVVVMECYPMMLQSEDGLESFMDLVVNVPLDSTMFRMAAATESPQAFHLLLSEWIRRRWRPLADRRQQTYPGQTYVPGGFVEVDGRWDSNTPFQNEPVFLAERQLKYIRKMAAFCKRRSVRLMLVLQPMPPAHLRAITNYDAALRRLRSAAEHSGAEFVDYNQGAVSPEEFAEAHTLSPAGAARISGLLADRIRARLAS